MVHRPGEDPGRAAAQRPRVDPGVLQRLPGGFQQQPLLGVHAERLARGDAEEAGVEAGGVGEEAALAGVAGPGAVGVGVVEALQVPAAVGGEAGDRVAAGGEKVPEAGRRLDPAGEAATDADDRDRLALALFARPQAGVGRAQLAGDLAQVAAQGLAVGDLAHPSSSSIRLSSSSSEAESRSGIASGSGAASGSSASA